MNSAGIIFCAECKTNVHWKPRKDEPATKEQEPVVDPWPFRILMLLLVVFLGGAFFLWLIAALASSGMSDTR
jgi:hypothetical protein